MPSLTAVTSKNQNHPLALLDCDGERQRPDGPVARLYMGSEPVRSAADRLASVPPPPPPPALRRLIQGLQALGEPRCVRPVLPGPWCAQAPLWGNRLAVQEGAAVEGASQIGLQSQLRMPLQQLPSVRTVGDAVTAFLVTLLPYGGGALWAASRAHWLPAGLHVQPPQLRDMNRFNLEAGKVLRKLPPGWVTAAAAALGLPDPGPYLASLQP